MAGATPCKDLGTVVSKEPLKTGIEAKDRNSVAQGLSGVLAQTYRLMVKSHVYHWNMVGPLFMPVHQLTEQHDENLFAATDEIAERVRALGFPSPHASECRLELDTISMGNDIGTTRHLIEDLIADHGALARGMRKIAKVAEEADDFASHDLMVMRLALHEKAIWMFRSNTAE